MGIDIKIPIGLMFSILGLLITIYGLMTLHSPIYHKSFDINVNLWSGIGMLIFGVIMLLFVKKKKAEEV
jgi:LPXTG-motif cell wall-anchored protein